MVQGLVVPLAHGHVAAKGADVELSYRFCIAVRATAADAAQGSQGVSSLFDLHLSLLGRSQSWALRGCPGRHAQARLCR